MPITPTRKPLRLSGPDVRRGCRGFGTRARRDASGRARAELCARAPTGRGRDGHRLSRARSGAEATGRREGDVARAGGGSRGAGALRARSRVGRGDLASERRRRVQRRRVEERVAVSRHAVRRWSIDGGTAEGRRAARPRVGEGNHRTGRVGARRGASQRHHPQGHQGGERPLGRARFACSCHRLRYRRDSRARRRWPERST